MSGGDGGGGNAPAGVKGERTSAMSGEVSKGVEVSSTQCGVSEAETHLVKKELAALGTAVTRTLEQAWVTGKALARAKRKVRHGFWLAYVEGVVGLKHRTAQRLIELYAKDPQKRRVTHFKSVAEALRGLAARPKKERESKSDDAGKAGGERTVEGGKGVGKSAGKSGGEESSEGSRDDGNWAAALARVLPVIREIGAEGSRLGEADLAGLVELTVVAATAVKRQLALASESDQYRGADGRSSGASQKRS